MKIEAISPRDVQSRLEKGEKLQIIDVREPGEVASGKIPGAKNIPLGQIPRRLNEIARDVETIMVCRSGGRSGSASEFLVGQGFRNVKNMTGGMLSWSGKVE